ncbi:MAG: hypothetical protein ACT4O5_11600 [Gammaproteobacteria bacterium]
MSETCATRDLVRNSAAMWLLWGLPAVIMLLTVYFAGSGWIVTTAWTLALGVMGGACLVNARSCGRMHCYFTGPFFLVMAVASLTYGLHLLRLGPHGWLYLGAVLLAGAGVFGCVPEWIWGRYRSAQTDSHGHGC